MSNKVTDNNLFMMCKECSASAFSQLPTGYSVRKCNKTELNIWKEFPFDNEEDKIKYEQYMTEYFDKVYKADEERFWDSCLFVCDNNDIPVGTCFAWKAYGNVTTIQWLKVKKEYEGYGLGRALLSFILRSLNKDDYPIYLHTQPGSFRAIKLYSDFGFVLLTDDKIGYRQNQLNESLQYLKENMPSEYYESLSFDTAPKSFLLAVQTSEVAQF